MATRLTSKSMEEAKQRLKRSLEAVESIAQTQFSILERDVLEAKAAKLSQEKELQELQQSYLREKSARENAERVIATIEPRLDELSGEILDILKNTGAS